jgi:hypothetical protein
VVGVDRPACRKRSAARFSYPYADAAVWVVAASAAACLFWFGLVAWRGVRLMRAIALREDRRYDRNGKFSLSSEYQTSDSATAARRNRRRNG